MPSPRYRFEGTTPCVDVRAQRVEHLFDNRDPAPFRARDLDPDLASYLVASTDHGVVMFGGEGATVDLADTWTRETTMFWSKKTPPGGPAYHPSRAMASAGPGLLVLYLANKLTAE